MEKFANSAQTTLAAGISSGAVSFQVANASAFPSSGNFRIRIDNELMLVTSVSGTTFNVTRNIEGTSAALHAFGSTVTLIATNGAMQAFRADTNNQGTLAARPAAGTAGVQYTATDANVVSVDNGSAWQTWGPVFPLTDPALTSFSFVNQGSATVSTAKGGTYLTVPAGTGSNSLSIYETTLIGTQATMLLAMNGGIFGGAWQAGVSFRAPGTGNKVLFFMLVDNGASEFLFSEWTDPLTFSSNPGILTYVQTGYWAQGPYLWVRYLNAAGTASYQVSGDGITFATIFSAAANTWLGANATTVGLCVNNPSGGSNVGVHLLSFSQP